MGGLEDVDGLRPVMPGGDQQAGSGLTDPALAQDFTQPLRNGSPLYFRPEEPASDPATLGQPGEHSRACLSEDLWAFVLVQLQDVRGAHAKREADGDDSSG